MKKKILFGILVCTLLFSVSGCESNENSNNNNNNNNNESNVEDNKKKEVAEYNAEFTELVNDKYSHVSYKLPKGYQSLNMYSDGDTNVMFTIETSMNDVARFHMYDKYAKKIEKVEINGVTYEYYRADYLTDWVVYIYRTARGKNDYYLFEFNAYKSNYDDNQIYKFMSTVVYDY